MCWVQDETYLFRLGKSMTFWPICPKSIENSFVLTVFSIAFSDMEKSSKTLCFPMVLRAWAAQGLQNALFS